jgi:hypothetical protein
LAAHGLAPPACDAVVGWVRRLVALTRETDLEHGLAFEAESGRQIGSHAVGERSAIELGPLLGAMRRDGVYAIVHTHPSDGPFSTRDVLLLFLRPEVRVSVVVGARGTVYVMSRGPSWRRPLFDEVAQAYADAIAAGDADTAAAIAAGRMPRWAARSEQVHRAWATVAPRFGLRYTRLEVG